MGGGARGHAAMGRGRDFDRAARVYNMMERELEDKIRRFVHKKSQENMKGSKSSSDFPLKMSTTHLIKSC